jgi:hypothetical protein
MAKTAFQVASRFFRTMISKPNLLCAVPKIRPLSIEQLKHILRVFAEGPLLYFGGVRSSFRRMAAYRPTSAQQNFQ